MPKHRVYHLTVKADFGAYRRGDHIEDQAEVDRILGGEHVHYVTKVAADPMEASPSWTSPISQEFQPAPILSKIG